MTIVDGNKIGEVIRQSAWIEGKSDIGIIVISSMERILAILPFFYGVTVKSGPAVVELFRMKYEQQLKPRS